MKTPTLRPFLLLILISLLGGCAAYDAQFARGRNLKATQRFFVVSNLNDNHAIDRQIVAVLKAREREADSGPLTMMPDDAQAIISYQDRWDWNFGDQLVFLNIAIRDPRAQQPFGSVTFSAKIPLREDVSVTIARLVDQLLDKK